MRFASKIHTTSGIALVMVLAAIVLMTILVPGFSLIMRTERQASSSMLEIAKSRIATRTALNHAIGLLAENIPVPADVTAPISDTINAPPAWWTSQPGLLRVMENAVVREIPLYTTNANYPGGIGSPDTELAELNARDSDGLPIINPSGASMRVPWNYTLQDRSKAASATNQIIARYAFWIDDESTKVNVNTAGIEADPSGKWARLDRFPPPCFHPWRSGSTVRTPRVRFAFLLG